MITTIKQLRENATKEQENEICIVLEEWDIEKVFELQRALLDVLEIGSSPYNTEIASLLYCLQLTKEQVKNLKL